jgi:hypothetical protein
MIADLDFNLIAYAERVAAITDDELSEEGKQLRRLVYPKRIQARDRQVSNCGWRFVGRNGGEGINDELMRVRSKTSPRATRGSAYGS